MSMSSDSCISRILHSLDDFGCPYFLLLNLNKFLFMSTKLDRCCVSQSCNDMSHGKITNNPQPKQAILCGFQNRRNKNSVSIKMIPTYLKVESLDFVSSISSLNKI